MPGDLDGCDTLPAGRVASSNAVERVELPWGCHCSRRRTVPELCCSSRGDAMTAAACGGDAIAVASTLFYICGGDAIAAARELGLQCPWGCHGSCSLQMLHRSFNASSCWTDVESFQGDIMKSHYLHQRLFVGLVYVIKNPLSSCNTLRSQSGQHFSQSKLLTGRQQLLFTCQSWYHRLK